MSVQIDFTPMEHATALSLVALAIAVMQNDDERGREHITLLSQPGIEESARTVLEKLTKPLEPAVPTLVLED
jgi:precorrin-6B methylase 1